jgi:hypothetical protein
MPKGRMATLSVVENNARGQIGEVSKRLLTGITYCVVFQQLNFSGAHWRVR